MACTALGISKVPITREEVKGKDKRKGERMLEEGNAGGLLGGRGGRGIPEASLFPPITGECGKPTGGPPGPGFPESTPRQGLQAPMSSPARSGHPFLLESPRSAGLRGTQCRPAGQAAPSRQLSLHAQVGLSRPRPPPLPAQPLPGTRAPQLTLLRIRLQTSAHFLPQAPLPAPVILAVACLHSSS